MDRQADFPFASGELSRLLSDIAVASKVVSKDVRRAVLLEKTQSCLEPRLFA